MLIVEFLSWGKKEQRATKEIKGRRKRLAEEECWQHVSKKDKLFSTSNRKGKKVYL